MHTTICLYVYMYVHICVYIRVYLNVYVCVLIYIYVVLLILFVVYVYIYMCSINIVCCIYIYIYGTPPPMDPGLVRLTCIFQCFMLLFASWICVKIGGRVVHVYDTHACIQM